MFLCAELNLTPEVLQNLTLIEIEKILESNRSSLKFFLTMPYSNGFVTPNCGNRLVYAKLDYNTGDQRDLFQSNFKSMTS